MTQEAEEHEKIQTMKKYPAFDLLRFQGQFGPPSNAFYACQRQFVLPSIALDMNFLGQILPYSTALYT